MIEPDNQTETVPLFPEDYRGSGLLMQVSSLPSTYGIGDYGPAAFAWVDRLQAAGQTWWQSLSFGHAGVGSSPYLSSSFAGNSLLISPEILIRDGLLRESDCDGCSFPASFVDYDAVVPFKHRLLDIAWGNFSGGARPDLKPDLEVFCQENAHWLDDYALFRALKARFGGVHYLEWPTELVRREPTALEHARRTMAASLEKVRFVQYLSFRHSRGLKDYANARGVRLIGDLPFFVSPDSSEVWVRPEYFLLDENLRPRVVAGAPPDQFNSLGQRWGNPAYNWDALRENGYQWCIDRIHAALSHVDVLRLDRFRCFAAAWHVPTGAPVARCGQWVAGPGARFFEAVRSDIGSLPLIAEDLGMITADVWHLLDQIEAPGTRVLQYAFDGHSDNPHLPDNYDRNTVAYTGTHNNPSRGWYETLPANERRNLWRHLRRAGGDASDVAPALIRLAWASKAALSLAPVQDLLNLAPDIGGANSCWRATPEMMRAPAFEWLRQLTQATKRPGSPGKPVPAPRLFEMAR